LRSPHRSRRALLILQAGLACGLAAVGTPALAAYPERVIKLVVPYPPGGATDVIGRIVAQELGKQLGQQVIIDNRGGAGGNIGAEAVAKAPADGYTLLMGALTSHATMATLDKGRLRYDLIRDFAPVMIVGSVPLVVVVHPGVPAKTLKEFVAYAKANPGKINYASSGAGAPQRMAAEILQRETGITMTHIAYKGSGPAMVDVVGGQVTMMVETAPASLGFIAAGKLRALAVASSQRISMLPDVPSAAEAGVPGLDVSSTFGVLAPAGTPAPVIARLNEAMARIVQSPEAKEALLKQGVYAAPAATPAQAGEQIQAEVARWRKLITEANIKSDE
jgi:tripartite-type tricarboxylate transporter receptor subunit TctC